LLEALAILTEMCHHQIFMGHRQIMEWKISMHERSDKSSIFGTTVCKAIPTDPNPEKFYRMHVCEAID
jgi:hypothetical protein